tara:strand:- start:64 stop:2577 length:2514 start_codon:yes stop_codon:yes gene_type:complete
MKIENKANELAKRFFELPLIILNDYKKITKSSGYDHLLSQKDAIYSLSEKIKNDQERIVYEIGFRPARSSFLDTPAIADYKNHIIPYLTTFLCVLANKFGIDRLTSSFNFIENGKITTPIIHKLLCLMHHGPMDTLNIIDDVSEFELLLSQDNDYKSVLNLNITVESFLSMHGKYESVKAYSYNQDIIDCLGHFDDKLDISLLPLNSEISSKKVNKFDLVLCNPPGIIPAGKGGFKKYLVQALKNVSEDGVVLFTMPLSTVIQESFKKFVYSNDLYLTGIFETEKIYTSLQASVVESNLAVLYIEKSKNNINDSIFLAKIKNNTPSIVRSIILDNFVKLKAHKANPSLGCFVQLSDYQGCSIIEFNENLAKKFKGTKTKKYRLKDLYSKIVRIENIADFAAEYGGNFAKQLDESFGLQYVFMPMTGVGDVSPEFDLTKKRSRYYQIYLKDEFDPNYICNYLNSKIGKSTREANSLGSTISYYTIKSMDEIQMYLPDYKTQLNISESQNKLENKKNYLNELIYDISSVKVFKDERILKEISKMNAEDNSLEVWNNTLPFPISSVLTWYIKTNKKPKKFSYLLRFFEAYTQFISVVLLSALASDREFYKKNKSNWQSDSQPKWITKSSFGHWLFLYGKLRDFIKGQYEKEDTKEFIINLIGQGSSSFVEFITNRQIIDILNRTCNIRNEYDAHSGMMTKDFQAMHLNSLEKHLNQIRERVSYEFDDFIVVYPINSELNRDGLNYNDCKLLKGPITPFIEQEVITSKQLVSKQLYFQIDQGQTPVKLLPFMKFFEETKAFYYYSRTDVGNIKYISHHYEDSEDTLEPKGEEWDEDIEFLF